MTSKNELKLQIGVLRKKKGITQEDLAQHLGISFQAVSKWENGGAYPDITLLPEIASFFGESVETILGLQPMVVSPSESYETIKSQLSAAGQDSLYEQAWNLSAVLFEALATKGWKEYVPWEQRNRLNEQGYHGWGTAINIEPEGFSMLTGDMTVIGLTKGVRLPGPQDTAKVVEFLELLADHEAMQILLSWLNHYQKEGNNTPLSKSAIEKMAADNNESCDPLLKRLSAHGWIIEIHPPDATVSAYQLNKILMLIPVLALLKTLVIDLHMQEFPARIE